MGLHLSWEIVAEKGKVYILPRSHWGHSTFCSWRDTQVSFVIGELGRIVLHSQPKSHSRSSLPRALPMFSQVLRNHLLLLEHPDGKKALWICLRPITTCESLFGACKTSHHSWIMLRHRERRPTSQSRHSWKWGCRPARTSVPSTHLEVLFPHPSAGRGKALSLLSQGLPTSKTPLFPSNGATLCTSCSPGCLSGSHARTLSATLQTCRPKLRLKEPVFALLGTSSLRQRPKWQCHCFDYRYASLGVNWESSVRVPLRTLQFKITKVGARRTPQANEECVESICNSSSFTENEDEFFFNWTRKNLNPKVFPFLRLLCIFKCLLS